MKPFSFALIVGRIWAVVSLSIVLIALFQGMNRAYVELDFRLFSGFVLLFGWIFDIKEFFSPFLSYANGYEINFINTFYAALIGFVDGFASGYLIAVIFNFVRKLTLNKLFLFTLSCGVVFGLCSYLLALVNIIYDLGYDSFDFSIRPVYIMQFLINSFVYSGLALDSYINFPHSYSGCISWLLWGFVDGFLGGVICIKFLSKNCLFNPQNL